jgi:hypothetical protein
VIFGAGDRGEVDQVYQLGESAEQESHDFGSCDVVSEMGDR